MYLYGNELIHDPNSLYFLIKVWEAENKYFNNCIHAICVIKILIPGNIKKASQKFRRTMVICMNYILSNRYQCSLKG